MRGLLLGSTHSYICINAYNKGYIGRRILKSGMKSSVFFLYAHNTIANIHIYEHTCKNVCKVGFYSLFYKKESGLLSTPFAPCISYSIISTGKSPLL